MRILNLLYYYEPYTSGLTICVARTVSELAAMGHQMSVVCGRHDPSLPLHEVNEHGVEITRVPVVAHLDRGIILPRFIPQAVAAMRHADIVQIDIPLVEAAPLALIARAMGKRVIVTHLSDLVLNRTLLTRFAAFISQWSGVIAGRLAHATVTLTRNRAAVSPVARRLKRNLHVIAPPCEVADVPPDARETFRAEHGLEQASVIGFVGRFASEKGIEILLQAIPAIRASVPNAIVVLVGPNLDERTGTPLRGPWDRWLDRYRDHVRILGRLSDVDLACFYHACDVFVLPSIDFTETFGMVQVEAMLCGTPVVASSLPGVDDPVLRTGYGLLAEPGNVNDLAANIIEVLSHRKTYRPDPAQVARIYSPDATTRAYLDLYRGMTHDHGARL